MAPCAGKKYPHDLISRGFSPQQLRKCRCREISLRLIEDRKKWPMTEINGSETPAITGERGKVKLCNVNTAVKNIPWSARKLNC